jgi:hypothetical protein
MSKLKYYSLAGIAAVTGAMALEAITGNFWAGSIYYFSVVWKLLDYAEQAVEHEARNTPVRIGIDLAEGTDQAAFIRVSTDYRKQLKLFSDSRGGYA